MATYKIVAEVSWSGLVAENIDDAVRVSRLFLEQSLAPKISSHPKPKIRLLSVCEVGEPPDAT